MRLIEVHLFHVRSGGAQAVLTPKTLAYAEELSTQEVNRFVSLKPVSRKRGHVCVGRFL